MPKSSGGGRGGGDRGRGRGGGDRGRGRGRGGGRGGHIGPNGDEEGRPRSMSGSYCGGGERRGSNQPRGSRGGGSKVGGRGGISRGGSSDKRLNAKQAVGRKMSEDKKENVKMASSVTSTAETSPAASSLGVEKAPGGALHLQSSKKGKKRGKFKTAGEDWKEESYNDGPCVEDLKLKSPEVKKSVASKPSSNPASPSSNQGSPNQIKSQALFASQDVRFKQKNSSKMSSLKVAKHSNYVQSHAAEKNTIAVTTPNASVDKKVSEKSRLNTQMSESISQSTGLKVLSVTSSYPGYVFTVNDRAKLVRSIPGVVIVNTALKGDSLILGVDIEHEKLSTIITQVEKEKSWTISLVDTTDRDAFAYFADWKLIPRVDKSGMFQLIVSLRGQGRRSHDEELKKRNQLLELVKDFNVAKVVHGEGETILLVGHVLEFVAYSDSIRKVFTMERRHTWQPKPVTDQAPKEPSPVQERHFWVKVKCPEMSNLSTAHKQFTVHHELSTYGKVLQMEHELFGAVDNYLVVFKDIGGDMKSLGEQFNLLEIWPDSLPDIYTPTYGVDGWGFYSVSGRFPEDLSTETRNRFAEDMKMIGAVGFRSGDDEDSFSLHFVNSRCLEQISRCAQFTSFRLMILSSIVRKPSLDKKLRKLVPTILKYKEIKMATNSCPVESPKVESNTKKVEEESVKDVVKENVAVVESTDDALGGKATKNEVVVIVDCTPQSQQSCDEKSVSNLELPSFSENEDVKSGQKLSAKKKGEKKVLLGDVAQSGQLDEISLLKICFKESGSLSRYVLNLSKFFNQIQDLFVTEADNSDVVLFKFPSQKKVDEVLKGMSEEATNTLEKLKLAKGIVSINVGKFFKNKFGIVLDKSLTIAKLKKEFGKFGQVDIEVRSRVIVLWFDSKLSFFKALTDRRSAKHKPVPAVMNFKFSAAGVEAEPTLVAAEKEGVDNEPPEPVVLSESFNLTEKEIFGFIWQKQKGNKNIRDDQGISRQVTNFIKKVSCQELTVDEDGLVVTFSSKSALTEALAQFCPPPVPATEQLTLLSRKFTLLPARGFYGLFSSKRVKPEDFDRFGDCKFKNSCIWFADKLVMFQVLRDPVISKIYPALFIDCRNIFILSSKNFLPVAKPSTLEQQVAKPTVHEKPAASSALKTSSSCPGVVTRAASAKMSCVGKLPEEVQEKIPPSSTLTKSTCPADKAIVTTVGSPSLNGDLETLTPSCTLLETLLQPDQSAVGMTTNLGVGRFGHIPSARMARTGYKQSKMPAMVRGGAVPDLFLEDKECYRNKKVTEAADLISNILHGQGREVKGDTLREIKMKRVESFLKDKLGVEVELTNEEEEVNVGKLNGFTKLRKPAIIIEEHREDALMKNKDEDKFFVDERAEELSSSKNANETLFSNKEAANVEAEQLAPIVPGDMLHEDNDATASAQDVEDSREMPMNDADPKEENAGIAVIDMKPNVDVAPDLTPDLIGLFTLTLSVSLGSDPSLLSSLEDDISWFDTPVSIMCVENGSVLIEVKLRTKDMATAVLGGLSHKYPGLEGDTTSSHADILPDQKTGLFTLCFTDTHKKRYKATLDKFRKYSKQPPIISRGLGLEQVLVGFHHKEEAVEAFRENLDSEEFPELHVAPVSRS